MKKQNLFVLLVLFVIMGTGCKAKKVEVDRKQEETVLYITRHGKTMLNTLDRVQGWADTPLTSEGKNVATDLGDGLKKEKIRFKKIYSSDSGRAKETAKIILDSLGNEPSEIIESQKLREACYGMYEGDLNSKMMERIVKENNMQNAEELTSMGMGMWKLSADTLSKIDELKMAESAEAIINRMTEELTNIAKKNYDSGGGNILIVGHGMAISLFLDSIDNSLDFEGHLPNASVSKVIYNGNTFKIETIGDTSYSEK